MVRQLREREKYIIPYGTENHKLVGNLLAFLFTIHSSEDDMGRAIEKIGWFPT